MSGFFENLNISNKPLFKLARERGFKITQLEMKNKISQWKPMKFRRLLGHTLQRTVQ